MSDEKKGTPTPSAEAKCKFADETDDGERWLDPCGEPAAFYSCNAPGDAPNACAKHKCRCPQPATHRTSQAGEKV